MRPRDFAYELPADRIAQRPLPDRSASRLLHVRPGKPGDEPAWEDLTFTDFGDLLEPGDLLVLNDTRVVAARLFGRKDTGGRIEMLLERPLGDDRALVQLKASRAPAIGARLAFDGDAAAVVEARQDGFFVLHFDRPLPALLEAHGHVPLPPYIERADDESDRERYQTVFARAPGAVAAPTAGLHFDRARLNHLRARGISTAFITLHVGAGTFQPLRPEQLASGELHAERVEVSAETCAAIDRTRRGGGRVVAVGTTTMRALESAARGDALAPFAGETRLFIRPGFDFRVVDALVTNFHLPGSSLLMLVCAFSGTETILAAYLHAVDAGYRFYSYGDAMFCHRSR